jgi:hypothetical protein
MTMRRSGFAAAAFLCVVLATCIGSPATAGQYWHRDDDGHRGHWRATHEAIYKLENLIAQLEADPATDDGYRGPIITRARADILRLRATLRGPRWDWPVACCYSRRPIYIR